MLRLQTFGGLSLTQNGALLQSAGTQRRQIALLAILAASGARGVSRDRLLLRLWPDRPADRARNVLKQTLYSLRRDLTEPDLFVGSANVALNPAVCSSDIADFEAAIGRHETEEAIALYGGPFLDGFYLNDAPEFERWVVTERERLERRVARALDTLAEDAERRGDLQRAADWWLRRAATDPTNSRVAGRLISALAATGDRCAALQHGRAHAALLWEDLGIRPDAQFAAVMGRLATGPALAANEASASAPGRALGPMDRGTRLDGEPGAIVPDEGTASSAVVEKRAEPAARLTTMWVNHRLAASRLWMATAGVLGVVVIVVLMTLWRQAGAHTDPRRVAVSVFENRTGESALAWIGQASADWIAQGLAQTALVEVAAPRVGRFRQARPAENDESVAEAERAGVVVAGSYYRVRDSLYFQVHVNDASRRSVARALPVVTGLVADPMPVIERVRQRVMGAVATAVDPRMSRWANAAAQPATFEAYGKFAEAMRGPLGSEYNVFTERQWATPRLREAMALDSTFAQPALWLMAMYQYDGAWAAFDTLAERLAARRDRLLPWDRAQLDLYLTLQDPRQHYDAARRLVELAPGSEWEFELAYAAEGVNRPHEVIDRLVRLNPAQGWLAGDERYWTVLRHAYHEIGDNVRALDVARRGAALPAHERRGRHSIIIELAALGRSAELETVLDQGLADPGPLDERALLWLGAIGELRTHGHGAAARRLEARFITWLADQPPVERRTIEMRDIAYQVLIAGERWREASALGLDNWRSTPDSGWAFEYVAVPAAALGDRATADSVAALMPERARLWPGEAEFVSGRVAALEGRTDDAVRLLGDAMRKNAFYRTRIHADAAVDRVRNTPGFKALLRPEG